jgi:hypothetical protein
MSEVFIPPPPHTHTHTTHTYTTPTYPPPHHPAHLPNIPCKIFYVGEANSITGGGQIGVSNTFVSALWVIDFLFSFVSVGADGVNINCGGTDDSNHSHYHPFVTSGIDGPNAGHPEVRPLYYGMLFFSQATATSGSTGSSSAKLTNVTTSGQLFAGGVKTWVVSARGETRVIVVNRNLPNASSSSENVRGASGPLGCFYWLCSCWRDLHDGVLRARTPVSLSH